MDRNLPFGDDSQKKQLKNQTQWLHPTSILKEIIKTALGGTLVGNIITDSAFDIITENFRQNNLTEVIIDSIGATVADLQAEWRQVIEVEGAINSRDQSILNEVLIALEQIALQLPLNFTQQLAEDPSYYDAVVDMIMPIRTPFQSMQALIHCVDNLLAQDFSYEVRSIIHQRFVDSWKRRIWMIIYDFDNDTIARFQAQVLTAVTTLEKLDKLEEKVEEGTEEYRKIVQALEEIWKVLCQLQATSYPQQVDAQVALAKQMNVSEALQLDEVTDIVTEAGALPSEFATTDMGMQEISTTPINSTDPTEEALLNQLGKNEQPQFVSELLDVENAVAFYQSQVRRIRSEYDFHKLLSLMNEIKPDEVSRKAARSALEERQLMWGMLLQWGNALLRWGNYAKAAEVYQECMQLLSEGEPQLTHPIFYVPQPDFYIGRKRWQITYNYVKSKLTYVSQLLSEEQPLINYKDHTLWENYLSLEDYYLRRGGRDLDLDYQMAQEAKIQSENCLGGDEAELYISTCFHEIGYLLYPDNDLGLGKNEDNPLYRFLVARLASQGYEELLDYYSTSESRKAGKVILELIDKLCIEYCYLGEESFASLNKVILDPNAGKQFYEKAIKIAQQAGIHIGMIGKAKGLEKIYRDHIKYAQEKLAEKGYTLLGSDLQKPKKSKRTASFIGNDSDDRLKQMLIESGTTYPFRAEFERRLANIAKELRKKGVYSDEEIERILAYLDKEFEEGGIHLAGVIVDDKIRWE